MQVSKVVQYAFSFTVAGIGFNFTIGASSEAEAIQSLRNSLAKIVEELDGNLKAPLKAN